MVSSEFFDPRRLPLTKIRIFQRAVIGFDTVGAIFGIIMANAGAMEK